MKGDTSAQTKPSAVGPRPSPYLASKPEDRRHLERENTNVDREGFKRPTCSPLRSAHVHWPKELPDVGFIAGNKFRLITAVHYDTSEVSVLRFLTHAEYSRNKWKQEL